jgi:hypothetical protein
MRYVLVILVIIFSGFTKPKLIKTKVADGIIVSLPADFRPMDNLDFTERYPSVRAPIAAYTNEDREIDFSVNISATQWPDQNLDMAKSFFKAGFANLFDKVEIIREGIHEVNGKKLIYFEFESRMHGNKMNESQRAPIIKYTQIQYLVEKDRTLVFSFNCPVRLKADWQEAASAIMKSIKIR